MTYRVLIDFGPIEITVMQFSDTPIHETIYQSALGSLKEEGFSLPDDVYPNVIITPAPEWDEE
jgi:hypothetical protein